MQTEKTRLATPWRYALGMLGLTIPGFMYTTFGTMYYNRFLGLSLATIALGNIFFTIWDAVNDPLCGYLSDRTRSRHGRRRPWLLIGAPLFAFFLILFFNPPAAVKAGAGLAVYFTLTLMLTETANTVLSTNYHSLFPELFTTQRERTQANGIRQSLQLAGMILGTALVPVFAESVGYPTIAIILSLVGMGLLVFSILGCKEDPRHAETAPPALRDSLRAVLKNKNFWSVSLTNFFYQATSGLVLASLSFFALYTLKLDGMQTTILLGTVFLSAIPAVLIWSALVHKWGSVNTWRAALAVFGLSFVPMMFVQSLLAAVLAGVVVGAGIAGVTATLDLINARIIDEDARVSGLRREGIYQSAISFVIRFSGLIRSLVFVMITVFFGFVNDANPGPHPDVASRWMFAVFPFILMVFSFVTSLFVKIPKEEA